MDPATLALALLLMFASGAMVLTLFRSRTRQRESQPPASAILPPVSETRPRASETLSRDSEPLSDESGRDRESGELDFRHRQFRRRMQGSVMVGAMGLLVLIGVLLTEPQWRVVHALALLVLSIWLMLLAAADWVATRHFFGRARHNLLLDEVRLQAKLRRTASQNRGQGDERAG